jgi:hypothetical protein
MPPRPSTQETHKKISDALAAISTGKRTVVARERHLVNDLAELGIDQNDFWNVVPILLKEIQACGPESCYAGGRPPTRAYEPEIKDEELWAYSWPSRHFGFQTYIKFVMRKNPLGQWVFLHLRLHKDSP